MNNDKIEFTFEDMQELHVQFRSLLEWAQTKGIPPALVFQVFDSLRFEIQLDNIMYMRHKRDAENSRAVEGIILKE